MLEFKSKLANLSFLMIGDSDTDIMSLFLIAFNRFSTKDKIIYMHKDFFNESVLLELERNRFLKYKIIKDEVIIKEVNIYEIRLLLSSLFYKNDEVYGKKKQISIIRDTIIKKCLELENKNIILKRNDLEEKDLRRIELIGTIAYLEKNREIIINDISNAMNILEVCSLPERLSNKYSQDFGGNEERTILKNFFPEFKIKLNNFDKLSIDGTPTHKTKKIKSIVCVKPGFSSNYQIIINNDYINPMEVSSVNTSWRQFLELAEEQEIDNDKGFYDFINGSRNLLVAKTGYKQTKILKVDNGSIVPNIPLSIITEKAYKTRMNKLNNN